MKCPYCGHTESKVTDKRDTDQITRRRRQCLKCGKRFTTYERPELELWVIKKDNRREPFKREKLKRGILRSFEKRPTPPEKIDKLIDSIINEVYTKSKNKEITSSKIGQIVMKFLKKADKIAYIRFASVYRDFKDIEDFKKELQKLLR